MSATCTGAAENSPSPPCPFPSWPSSLLPQHVMMPVWRSAQECPAPAMMSVASVRSDMSSPKGIALSESLLPQLAANSARRIAKQRVGRIREATREVDLCFFILPSYHICVLRRASLLLGLVQHAPSGVGPAAGGGLPGGFGARGCWMFAQGLDQFFCAQMDGGVFAYAVVPDDSTVGG